MSGRGGNSRKNRHRFPGRRDEAQKYEKKHIDNPFSEVKPEANQQDKQERLLWTAPVLPVNNPKTTPDCAWCGKQIADITTAISDKDTGTPVHFDCVIARIAEAETMEANDSVCYIGGGRFGIVNYNNPPDAKDFSIKKIFEWEIKDKINEWRRPISEYFSIT
ncbi:MAG: hypothetical protein LBI12_02875 [Treponema sp.]|jgi:hypothetical protein|nr:hypothetical protein [Treponema sp.]